MRRFTFSISFVLVLLFFYSCETDFNNPTLDKEGASLNKGTNYALKFDGTDDFVEVAQSPTLNLIHEQFTVAAWVYLDAYVEWASVLTYNIALHQSGPDFQTEPGHIRFTGPNWDYDWWTNGLPEANTQIPLQEWHHIAVTYNGNFLIFYFDGREDGVYEMTGTFDLPDHPLTIGVDPPGSAEYWNGMLDDIKIWRKGLNRGQINAAMQGEAIPVPQYLIAYWNFNEGSGNMAYDKTGNNNGVLINSPQWVVR